MGHRSGPKNRLRTTAFIALQHNMCIALTSMTSISLSMCLVCPTCCNVGLCLSQDRPGIVATFVPKLARIVMSCDPANYSEESTSAVRKNVEFCGSAASDGSHVVLSQHLLSAKLSRI